MQKTLSLKKTKIFTLFLALIFLFSTSPQKPEAIFGLSGIGNLGGNPYGGMVVWQLWCYGGLLTYLIKGTEDTVMQLWGSDYRKYGHRPATHSKNVVGKGFFQSPCFIPCHFGACYVGHGIPTLVQGQSR